MLDEDTVTDTDKRDVAEQTLKAAEECVQGFIGLRM
jgi:hypothetical protein